MYVHAHIIYLLLLIKKLKEELSCNSTIPLLGIYLKEVKSLSQRDVFTPMFIAVFFTIAKKWKQAKCLSKYE